MWLEGLFHFFVAVAVIIPFRVLQICYFKFIILCYFQMHIFVSCQMKKSNKIKSFIESAFGLRKTTDFSNFKIIELQDPRKDD